MSHSSHHATLPTPLTRKLSPMDNFISKVDSVVRTLSANSVYATRPSPAKDEVEPHLSEQERRHTAGLMRINHTGEVCAQALYQGQATTAKLKHVEEMMQQAALEEVDHLAWCEDRLKELNSRTSHLNPIWYTLSFGLGAAAGWAGDEWSLGFVVETERQVCRHLDNHLKQLPPSDRKSKKILQQMRQDEAEHAQTASRAGGRELPAPLRYGMTLMSKVMTATTYRI